MNEQTTSPTLTREALEKRRKSLVEERFSPQRQARQI
jgi:hypothetical protein